MPCAPSALVYHLTQGLKLGQLTFAFNVPDGIDTPTHYRAVYRTVGANASSELFSPEELAAAAQVTVSGLTLGVNYTFQIIGRNLNTEGYLNAVRSISVVASPMRKPPRLGEPVIVGVTGSSISVTWAAPQGTVTLYRIDIADDTALINGARKRLSDFGLSPRWNVAGYTNTTSFVIVPQSTFNLTSGLPVLVRVMARNLNVDGYGEGTVTRATPRDSPPNPPQDFKVRSVTANSVFLQWRPPQDYNPGDEVVTKYRIEGCAINCGTDALFPTVAAAGDKFYVLGGAEYEWTGTMWALTGKTFWRTVAVVHFTVLSFNVTQVDNAALVTNRKCVPLSLP